MSIRNFVPTVWSAKIFQELDKALVLAPLCNTDYEGEITNYGDQVKINSVGDITVRNYAPNVTTITPQQLDAQQQVLEIDRARYFAFYIDDVDNAQTKPKLMGEAMRKSAYALADDTDQYIAALWSQAGPTVNSTACTIARTMTVLSNAARVLDERNVPSQGRWMVIPPWFHQKMILAQITLTRGVENTEVLRRGYIGTAFGFDFYLTNNLTTGGGAANTLYHHRALAGTDRAMSFANQVVKTEAYRPENSFSDAVKGLHVYGAKVIDPNALALVNIATSS